MFSGLFNNTDEIVIYNRYDKTLLNKLNESISLKHANMNQLKTTFINFTLNTFGNIGTSNCQTSNTNDMCQSIFFPNDNEISSFYINVYLQRLVKYLVHNYILFELYHKNKFVYYECVVNFVQRFLEYIQCHKEI